MKYSKEIRQGAIDFLIGVYDGFKTIVFMFLIIALVCYLFASFPIVAWLIYFEGGPWGWFLPGVLAWVGLGIVWTSKHGKEVRQDGNINRWIP